MFYRSPCSIRHPSKFSWVGIISLLTTLYGTQYTTSPLIHMLQIYPNKTELLFPASFTNFPRGPLEFLLFVCFNRWYKNLPNKWIVQFFSHSYHMVMNQYFFSLYITFISFILIIPHFTFIHLKSTTIAFKMISMPSLLPSFSPFLILVPIWQQ